MLGGVFLALAVGLMAAPGTQAESINLGSAGPAFWAVLGLGANVTINGDTTGVVGNVGVNPNGIATGDGTITGDLLLASSAQNNFTSPTGVGHLIGNLKTNAGTILAQAKADAIQIPNLPAPPPPLTGGANFYAAQSNNNSIVATANPLITQVIGNGSLNVINIASLLDISGGHTLQLVGGAADAFVFNVGGLFELDGTIQLVGGVLPQNVLINETGGGLALVNDTGVMSGIILDATGFANIHGQVTGEVIANQVTVQSGGFVDAPPAVPIPPTAILLGSGLLGLGLLGGRKKWFRKGLG